MLLDRTVLVKPSVQPGMGTDSVSTVENLYRDFGEPDIYLLLDVFFLASVFKSHQSIRALCCISEMSPLAWKN